MLKQYSKFLNSMSNGLKAILTFTYYYFTLHFLKLIFTHFEAESFTFYFDKKLKRRWRLPQINSKGWLSVFNSYSSSIDLTCYVLSQNSVPALPSGVMLTVITDPSLALTSPVPGLRMCFVNDLSFGSHVSSEPIECSFLLIMQVDTGPGA